MAFRTYTTNLLLIFALLVPSGAILAHSPSPEAKAQFIAEGTWEQKKANLRAFDAAQDPDMYERSAALHLDRHRSQLALSTDAVDTVRVAVILVDFPDFRYDDTSYQIPGGGTLQTTIAGTPAMFDSLLFSQRGIDAVSNPTGSMTEYYLENSYGKYFVQGDVLGWYQAPNNYSYYVGTSDGLGGRGSELAADAVLAADADGVDFSPYANGGFIVPGVIIVHAGPGAEQGAYGIWSHRSSMNVGGLIDGVSLSGYSMQPEENAYESSLAHMGVYCHEWGHVLGAPDWYDTQYNSGSEGLGSWCIMASGSWNNSGKTPAHFNCWTKYNLGFNDMIFLTENYSNAPIPPVASSPTTYCLRQNPVDNGGGEFWFVENRQKVGFDEYLPGSGLIIYHFDPTFSDNSDSLGNYQLAVEEADGRRDLAFNGSRGQASDPFPGTWNNRTFHGYTTPDSRTNAGEVTEVSVLNVSDSDSIMYADLNVKYAFPYLILTRDSLSVTDDAPGGNGDGSFEQGETMNLHLEVRNVMMLSYYPIMHLDVDNADVEILQNDRSMGFVLNRIISNVNSEPITFHIPDDFVSSIVHFTLTITSSNDINNQYDRSFTNTFEFDITLGRSQILLVDDDNDYGDDPSYRNALNRLGLPFEHWDKSVQGSPTYAAVAQYPHVFWMTGSYWPPSIPGGTFTAADVTFMKELLDNGGNLLLASPSAPVQLQALDPDFMADYLHADLTGSRSERYFLGDDNHVLGGGLFYTTKNGVVWDEVTPTLAPINGGVSVFNLMNQSGTLDYGSCGVAYDGLYRTAFLSFPIEFLDADQVSQGYAPPDSLILNALKFFSRGAATAVEDNTVNNLLPTDFALDQNYPNPFNPSTTISYSIEAGQVEQTNLSIFNVLGQKVATLVDQVQGPGYYATEWSGQTADGSSVASGIYFYRLTHGDRSETRKMMLLK